MTDLLAHLRRHAAADPARPALTWLDDEGQARPLSFGELELAAQRLAAQLHAACPHARRALLLHRPGPAFVIALCACWMAGITPVPTYPPNYRLGTRASQRFERLAADADAQLALAERASLGRVWQAGRHAGAMLWMATDDLDAGDAPPLPLPPRQAAPALIQYTSGSTGTPRGVCLSHANLEANLAAIAGRFGIAEGSCVVSWLPPYHDMGLIGGLLPMLRFGVHLVAMAPSSFISQPRRWLAAISQYRARFSGGPNFAYALCAHKLGAADLAGLDLSCWQVAFCGAETVRAGALSAFAALTAPAGLDAGALMPCYGLAEATLLVAARQPGSGVAQHRQDAAAPVRVACGTPAPGVALAIVDAEGRRCAEGVDGEIWIAGASVAAGYRRQDQLDTGDFGHVLDGSPHRWLRSGDTGYLHAGELYVTGRLKDLVILRGRNYYPADIEQVAGASHPAIDPLGVAAFAVDGAEGEQLVLACELQRARRHADSDQVERALQGALAQALELRADHVALLRPGALPRTTSGKISRSAARAAWLAGELALAPRHQAAAPGAADPLLACVARMAGVEADRIDAGWTLGELGIDSLRRVELALALEQELGHALAVELLQSDLSVAGLRTLLDTQGTAPFDGSGDTGGGAALALSPGQRDLLDAGVGQPNDFIEIAYLRAPPVLREDALRAALDWASARHPALRVRFLQDGDGWQARLDGRPIGLARLDMGEAGATWRATLLQGLRETIDLRQGQLGHAIWLDRGPTATGVLAVAVHHAAIDAVSMAILLRDVQHAYGLACAGPLPAARPDAYLDWLQAGAAQAADPAWRARQQTFWLAECGAAPARAAQPWPLEVARMPLRRLSPLANRHFLEQFGTGRARHDALLAAFTHAVCAEHGTDSMLVLLNHHGRHGRAAGAVGWLVNFYAARMARADGAADQLAQSRADHARVAPHAASYGWLRHASGVIPPAMPTLAMEFRGAADNGFRRDGTFAFLGTTDFADAWQEALARAGRYPHLALYATLSDGALAWSVHYLPGTVTADLARALDSRIAHFLEHLLSGQGEHGAANHA